MNIAAVGMSGQTFLCPHDYISLGKYPRVQFLCNMVATLFSLLDTATVFRVVVPFYILTAMYESFIFPAFLAFGTVIIFLF